MMMTLGLKSFFHAEALDGTQIVFHIYKYEKIEEE